MIAVAVFSIIARCWLVTVCFGRDDRQDVVQQQLRFAYSVAVKPLSASIALGGCHRHVEQLGIGTIIRDLAVGQD